MTFAKKYDVQIRVNFIYSFNFQSKTFLQNKLNNQVKEKKKKLKMKFGKTFQFSACDKLFGHCT